MWCTSLEKHTQTIWPSRPGPFRTQRKKPHHFFGTCLAAAVRRASKHTSVWSCYFFAWMVHWNRTTWQIWGFNVCIYIYIWLYIYGYIYIIYMHKPSRPFSLLFHLYYNTDPFLPLKPSRNASSRACVNRMSSSLGMVSQCRSPERDERVECSAHQGQDKYTLQSCEVCW